MSWQDILFAIGSAILLTALFPSVLSKNDKPALVTSLITGPILIMFGIILVSLDLWIGGTLTGITGTVWLVLAYQKFTLKKKTTKN